MKFSRDDHKKMIRKNILKAGIFWFRDSAPIRNNAA
jgi:hypothetical protein